MPLSPNSRRVWLALLEKGIPFEPMPLQLNGDQFDPAFLAINPFHHVPVIEDARLRVVESLAILDYLEARYPAPQLMPADAAAIATVRMVQMISVNELYPAIIALIAHHKNPQRVEQSHQQIHQVLRFFSEQLGDRPYFGSEHLTVADIVAGTLVPLLPSFEIDLTAYGNVDAWLQRLLQREAWQQTQPDEQTLEEFKRRVRVLVRLKLHQQKV